MTQSLAQIRPGLRYPLLLALAMAAGASPWAAAVRLGLNVTFAEVTAGRPVFRFLVVALGMMLPAHRERFCLMICAFVQRFCPMRAEKADFLHDRPLPYFTAWQDEGEPFWQRPEANSAPDPLVPGLLRLAAGFELPDASTSEHPFWVARVGDVFHNITSRTATDPPFCKKPQARAGLIHARFLHT